MDYDLDEQDRQWLTAFNNGQERLPYRRMELLLWKLDTANAEATDSAFASECYLQLLGHVDPALYEFETSFEYLLCTLRLCSTRWQKHVMIQPYCCFVFVRYSAAKACGCKPCCRNSILFYSAITPAGAGASIAERTSPAACATTDHMSREQAMEALTQAAAARQPVKDAVYRYWLDKRKQLGKPLLRRLQAPTNSSDTNPHSCFRCSPLSVIHSCCHTLLNQPNSGQSAVFLCRHWAVLVHVGSMCCMQRLGFQLLSH